MSETKSQIVMHACGASFRVEYMVPDGPVTPEYHTLDCPKCGQPVRGQYPSIPVIAERKR